MKDRQMAQMQTFSISVTETQHERVLSHQKALEKMTGQKVSKSDAVKAMMFQNDGDQRLADINIHPIAADIVMALASLGKNDQIADFLVLLFEAHAESQRLNSAEAEDIK